MSMRGLGHSLTGVWRQLSLKLHVLAHHVHWYFALRVTHREQSGCSRWDPRMSHLYNTTLIVSTWWFRFQTIVTLAWYSPVFASYEYCGRYTTNYNSNNNTYYNNNNNNNDDDDDDGYLQVAGVRSYESDTKQQYYDLKIKYTWNTLNIEKVWTSFYENPLFNNVT